MIERQGRLGHGEFVKYQALGNDYLVVDAKTWPEAQEPRLAQKLCHRHLGVGADGVLVLLPPAPGCDANLAILNPDGSVAEKSGNGLRIFARALYDLGYVREQQLTIGLDVGAVEAKLICDGQGEVEAIEVAMGHPASTCEAVGFLGTSEDPLHTPLDVLGQTLHVALISMGNPHCVVFVDALDTQMLRTLGPAIENHAHFRHRTNVQFARVQSATHVDILIWERGAGETAASGSSSCAVAVAGHRRGLLGQTVMVTSPGGALQIALNPSTGVMLTGPCAPVCRGRWQA